MSRYTSGNSSPAGRADGAFTCTLGAIRVSNDSRSLRNRLNWFSAAGGVGGTIGGALGLILDIGSTGLSGGVGTLVGAAIGGAAGTYFMGRADDSPALLEKGEAFEYLYAARYKNPKVANPRLVEEALKRIPSFDKNDDRRHWYAKVDLDRFLEIPSLTLIPPLLVLLIWRSSASTRSQCVLPWTMHRGVTRQSATSWSGLGVYSPKPWAAHPANTIGRHW
jgi:hypothetical protein